MTPIYVLAEHGNPQGSVLIGLYADRAHALDVAGSHAHHRLQRCRQGDARYLGVSLAEPTYEIVRTDCGSLIRVILRHLPSGESDTTSWTVEPRTVIPPPALDQPDLPSIFAHAEGAS